MKTQFVRARIQPDLKEAVHHVLAELGVTPTQAIIMFYKFINRTHSLPFDLSLPNRETVEAIEDARKGKNIINCSNSKELFEKLGL